MQNNFVRTVIEELVNLQIDLVHKLDSNENSGLESNNLYCDLMSYLVEKVESDLESEIPSLNGTLQLVHK